MIAERGLEAKLGAHFTSVVNISGLDVSKVVSCRTSLMYVHGQFFKPTRKILRPEKQLNGWAEYSIALSGMPKNEWCVVSEEYQSTCCLMQAKKKLVHFHKPTFVTKESAPKNEPITSPFLTSLAANNPRPAESWTMLLQ